MGRFYFHLREGAELIRDPEGTDLRDAAEAKRMALLSARELLAGAIKSGERRIPEAFVITDEAGQTLHVLPFVEVLPEPLKVK
jgi:hypothetical protein